MVKKIISEKIHPYHLDKNEELTIAKLSSQFSYELLLECIDVGVASYFRYDENGILTRESVTIFLEKLGGIAYIKSRSPIEQKILHIKNVGKFNIYDWNDKCAMELLHSFVSKSLLSKIPESKILEELDRRIMYFTRYIHNWTEWLSAMTQLVDGVMKQIEINTSPDVVFECF